MMTRREIEACKLLLDDDGTEEGLLDSEENTDDFEFYFAKAVAAGEKRKEREVTGKSKHVDCSFVMGAASCAERLWSKGDDVKKKAKEGHEPYHFGIDFVLKEK